MTGSRKERESIVENLAPYPGMDAGCNADCPCLQVLLTVLLLIRMDE